VKENFFVFFFYFLFLKYFSYKLINHALNTPSLVLEIPNEQKNGRMGKLPVRANDLA